MTYWIKSKSLNPYYKEINIIFYNRMPTKNVQEVMGLEKQSNIWQSSESYLSQVKISMDDKTNGRKWYEIWIFFIYSKHIFKTLILIGGKVTPMGTSGCPNLSQLVKVTTTSHGPKRHQATSDKMLKEEKNNFYIMSDKNM